jgi:hypothetical protein
MPTKPSRNYPARIGTALARFGVHDGQLDEAGATAGGEDDKPCGVEVVSLGLMVHGIETDWRRRMARFSMETWLMNYGFRRVTGEGWWAWPDGLPYLAVDVVQDAATCVISEYRDQYPSRAAVGEVKEEVWDPEEPAARWTEYRFPWPATLAQAEAIAEAMGWRDDAAELKDTPLDE